jgi:hypothetical protein
MTTLEKGFQKRFGFQVKSNKGAPLGVKPYEDIIPALNNQLCVVDQAPHPHMAKLFAAWHAAEGIHLIARRCWPLSGPTGR